MLVQVLNKHLNKIQIICFQFLFIICCIACLLTIYFSKGTTVQLLNQNLKHFLNKYFNLQF